MSYCLSRLSFLQFSRWVDEHVVEEGEKRALQAQVREAKQKVRPLDHLQNGINSQKVSEAVRQAFRDYCQDRFLTGSPRLITHKAREAEFLLFPQDYQLAIEKLFDRAVSEEAIQECRGRSKDRERLKRNLFGPLPKLQPLAQFVSPQAQDSPLTRLPFDLLNLITRKLDDRSFSHLMQSCSQFVARQHECIAKDAERLYTWLYHHPPHNIVECLAPLGDTRYEATRLPYVQLSTGESVRAFLKHFPTTESLYCKGVDPSQFPENVHFVEHLILPTLPSTEAAVQGLEGLLSRMQHLKKLSLSFSSEHWLLFRGTSLPATLETVIIDSSTLTDAALANICKLPLLKDLRLHKCLSLTTNGLKAIGRASSLQYLSLSRTQIDRETYQEIFSKCVNLKSLHTYVNSLTTEDYCAIDYPESLEELSIDNDLNSFELTAKVMRQCRNLRIPPRTCVHFTAEQIQELQLPPTLTQFSFGSGASCESLRRVISCCPRLDELWLMDLSMSLQEIESMQEMPSVTMLTLIDFSFRRATLQVLLTKFSSLKSFWMSSCPQISASDILSLDFDRELEELNLLDTPFQAQEAIEIYYKYPRLREFKFGHNDEPLA
jgi:hypothetical protein